MTTNLLKSARSGLGVCTIALASLTLGGCMMGQPAMSPAMMETESAMHHFTMAVHMGEIEEAQLAVSKSSDAQVRDFAQRMITEHTAAMEKELQMMRKMGMATEMGAAMGASGNMQMNMTQMRAMLMENPHSRPVMENHMQAMQMLQAANGMAFNRAYMNRQVAMHRFALENMERMMASMGMAPMAEASMQGSAGAGMDHGNMNMNMPATPEGRMMMHRALRAMLASHLQMAQQMSTSMGSM